MGGGGEGRQAGGRVEEWESERVYTETECVSAFGVGEVGVGEVGRLRRGGGRSCRKRGSSERSSPSNKSTRSRSSQQPFHPRWGKVASRVRT